MVGSLPDRLAALWESRLSGLDAHVSLQLRSVHGPVLGRDEATPHYAASTIKLAVLGAQLASGRQDLLRVHADFAGAVGPFSLAQADDQDDATWAALGTSIHTATLAARMIQLSGNLATDLLVEWIGLAAVAGFVDRAGLSAEVQMGRLIGDDDARAAGITNSVTAAGLARLLAGLVDGTSLGGQSRRAIGLLAGQRHRNLIPAGLPAGTWTANKSGWVSGIRHDVALIRPVRAPAYILAVCTTSGLSDAESEALVADLSRITYREWMYHGGDLGGRTGRT